MHWASSRGNTDIMEMLIASNCDIEARDKVRFKTSKSFVILSMSITLDAFHYSL